MERDLYLPTCPRCLLTEALRVREETEDFEVLVIRGQRPRHAAVNR